MRDNKEKYNRSSLKSITALVLKLQYSSSSVSPYFSYPSPLQLSLGVGLLVVQRERLSAGGRRWTQARAVSHWETQRDKHPWGRVAVQEGCSQPVVLLTGILVDIADLKGSYELPSVIQDADLIPLKESNSIMSLCKLNSAKQK